MSSGMKTILLALLSVVVAGALIFAGTLLGMDAGVERAVRDFFGWEAQTSVDEVDVDLQEEIRQLIEANYFEEIEPGTLARGAIDGMLAGLGDPYTVYYDPEEYKAFKEEASGSYSGVGMTVQMSEQLVTVVAVFESSPAEAAQIQAGDIVLSVDGVSATGRTIDEVVSDIKGPEGTKVVLEIYRPAPVTTTSTTIAGQTDTGSGNTTVTTEDITVDLTGLPPGGTTTEYTLTRRSIVIPTTDVELLEAAGKKVAHIILYTFNNANASQELRADVDAAIAQEGVQAIILDLRGNGGGLLNAAVEVASIFIESGVIVSTEGLHSPEEELVARGGAVEDVSLYVLTDEFTASASEIVAGALQDYGRATILGETTFGKGLVQSVVELSNEGAIKLTTAVYFTPKGRDINEKGISPDIVAPDDPATQDVDETVVKVLDLIAGGSAGR
jgi:carboxyl-terminal processing protease